MVYCAQEDVLHEKHDDGGSLQVGVGARMSGPMAYKKLPFFKSKGRLFFVD